VLAIADRIHAASRLRAEAGASGDIEESLAQTAVGELRATIADAVRRREAHLSELRELLDLPATDALDLTTPLEEPDAAPPDGALVQRALRSRPELDLVRERVLALEATDDRLAREVFPRVGAYVGVDAAPASPVFGVVGVSVELPFAQRNQGPRAVAQAARAGELAQLELQGRRIAREVTAARAGYEARRAQLKGITQEALPAAERTLELVELGWRSGRFDLFRVTSAARDVSRVRGLRVDALEAAWVERVALERAVGGAAR
jgi:cobalt-zinc-cadmium efflux system outer membrane protein